MKRRAHALRTALLAGSVLLGTAACGPAALSTTATTGSVED
ncbi:MAG: hypothetical protein JWP46_2350, partial [Modestobacter sp.]|nr:hypothetical protein [Modestobacter sp.]